MMKYDKISTLLYVGLGILSGFGSNLLNNLIVSVSISAIIFAASIYFLLKKYNPPKRNKFIGENLVTFLLIWLVVWILLANLSGSV